MRLSRGISIGAQHRIETLKTTDTDLLTKRQLAERLGFTSTRIIDQMMSKRMIPFFKWGHRTTRFSWARCKEALAKYEVKAVGQ